MTYLPSFSSQLLVLSALFRSLPDCSFSLDDALEDALEDALCACSTSPPRAFGPRQRTDSGMGRGSALRGVVSLNSERIN